MKKRTKLIIGAIILALLLSTLGILPILAQGLTVGAITLEVMDSAGGTVQDTRVGTLLYVSNDTTDTTTPVAINPYNWVRVTLAPTGTALTTTVIVRNANTAATLTVIPSRTTTTDPFVGEFQVGKSAATSTIAASDGHILEVQYATTGDVAKLTVDGVAPSVSSLSPAHKTFTRATTIDFGGTITDAGSGMRADTPDNDGDTVKDEPLTVSTTTPRTVDIGILVASTLPETDFIGAASDFSDRAIWSTTTDGFTFVMTRLLTEGKQEWRTVARDRVGNVTISDADAAVAGKQDHEVTVDPRAPVINTATTGKAWDGTKKEIKSARDSILLEFVNSGVSTRDLLNAATVDTSDFTVAGATVIGVVFPNIPDDPATPEDEETRDMVFLTLAADLAADAKPKVSLVGTVEDLATNVAPIQEKTAADGIGPKFTVTITGEASSRPIVSDKTGAKVTVRVVSDEALNAAPTVAFMELSSTTTSPYVVVGAAPVLVTATAVSGLSNTWEVSYDPTGESRLVNVQVSGLDFNSGIQGIGGQPTTAPPSAGQTVDLTKAYLFEFDKALNKGNDPTFKLIPDVAGQPTQTESANPFIRIDFDDEGSEYPIDTSDKITIGTTDVEVDSHDGVTLTKITLDGVDVSAQVGSIDSNSVQVATTGLALGTHTLLVNATDAVGNALLSDKKFEFTVIERRAHKVSLVPGFNLISFPGEPIDPDINVVLAGNAQISTVLTYDPADPAGPWLVATRNATTGLLEGTLSTIDGRHAYWVQTTTFDPVSTVLAEREFSQLPPSIPLIAGWNLVPVADLQLGTIGTEFDPDIYFASAAWSVAYHFDASTNQWMKIVPDQAGDPKIKSGQGWWLFTTKSGYLVP